VDYGAALEMRFGATRRGFESRPLRHLRMRPLRALPRAVLAHALCSALAPVLSRRLRLGRLRRRYVTRQLQPEGLPGGGTSPEPWE
jgi:hypothetical protein